MGTDQYRVAVVGGGASGMMAAIAAAMVLPGRTIVLLEKNGELGKKLLATGNGRCNLSHRDCRYSDYGPGGSLTVRQIFSKMNVVDTTALFEEIGLMTRDDEEGRRYPYSEQASTVRDLLEGEIRFLGIESRTGDRIATIARREDGPGFVIGTDSGATMEADALVLATGGKAGGQYGSTGDGYGFAKAFGHSLVRPRPALVPVVGKDWPHGDLKGVRAKGAVRLEAGDRFLAECRGEIQFTAYGLSGICLFDLSRFLDPEETDAAVRIDLFPELSQRDLAAKLFARAVAFSTRPPEALLQGMLHSKLISLFLPAEGKSDPERLAARLKNWRIPIAGTRGWNEAQVTVGGVDCSEVYPHTLGSRIVPGLYFAGELLDVDGPCGGWNLQWAWSSGYTAGECAALWAAGLQREGEATR